MTNTEAWTPKVGDPVKYVSQSLIGGGRICNVQIMHVSKITAAGYVYLDRRRDAKFKAGLKQDRLYEHVPKGHHFQNYRTWLERPTEQEIATLPRGDAAGSAYARDHQAELRA